MGVVSLLLYFAGGLLFVLAGMRFVDAAIEGDALGGSVTLLLVAAGLLLVASSLHGTVVKWRGDAGALADPKPASAKALAIALGVWALPILAAWLQFELYASRVYMVPVATILGGFAFGYLLSTRIMRKGAMRSPRMMLVVMLVGMPAAALGTALPLRHFQHHLTDVVVISPRGAQRRTETRVLTAEPPTRAPSPLPNLDETLHLTGQIAEAEPVDVEAEIAAGRYRRLDDGSLVVVHADGSTTPVSTGLEELLQELERAQAADDATTEAEQRAHEQSHLDEVARRRGGGRLFSSRTP